MKVSRNRWILQVPHVQILDPHPTGTANNISRPPIRNKKTMRSNTWRQAVVLAVARSSVTMALAPRTTKLKLHHHHQQQQHHRIFIQLWGSCAASSSSLYASTQASFSNLRLRNATIDDLATVQRWDEQPHLQQEDVMGDNDFNDWNWLEELGKQPSWRFQLIAEINGTTPIGMIQIIDPAKEESHYWGHDCPPNLRAIDIWIGEPEYLGQGYGTQMMTMALEDYCFSDPTVEAVLVDPMAKNLRAHRFYQKLGFEPQELRYFGPDETLVHKLTREKFERGQRNAA
jgi:aminoglycoside 6'-N-acetyltransferase